MVRAFKKKRSISKGHNGLITFDKVIGYQERGHDNRIMKVVLNYKRDRQKQNRKRIQQRWVRVR